VGSKDFAGFESVYLLEDPLWSTALRGNINVTLEESLPMLRGEGSPSHPVEISRHSGGALRDLVWTSLGLPIVVNDRVVQLLSEHAFTGWNTYPVVVVPKTGELIQTYRGLSVTVRCGPVDCSKSLVAMSQYPAGTFPVRRGLFFDPSTWDGSDLFMPQDSVAHVFVLDTVRDAFDQARSGTSSSNGSTRWSGSTHR
jgi:hypothetical protein